MITQKIIARTDSLKLDKIISRYGEDSMRQVVFIIVRPDPDSDDIIPITIPEDAVGSFRILKPSGNFVIVPMSKSVLSTGETAFDVVLPASANTAKGSGYYDIRITSDTDKYYFTAQGDFLIDDNIISDEVLEDVSEVNGLVFPDDFLTTDDHFAQIVDSTISSNSVWSSEKTNDVISNHSVYSETVLYEGGVSSTSNGVPVALSDSIQNYDIIIFNIVKHTKDQLAQVFYLTSNLTVGQLNNQVVNVNDRTVCFWQYVTNNNILWLSAYTADVIDLVSITGLKFNA